MNYLALKHCRGALCIGAFNMWASSVYHLEKTRGDSAVIQAFWDGFLAGLLVCLFVFMDKFSTSWEVQKHKKRGPFLQISFWKFRITVVKGCCRQVWILFFNIVNDWNKLYCDSEAKALSCLSEVALQQESGWEGYYLLCFHNRLD